MSWPGGPSAAELSAEILRDAANRVLRYLQDSEGWRQLALAEDQFHTGDDPIVADGEAHQLFTQYVLSHPAAEELSIWGIVGEENADTPPDRLQPGTRVVVVDPLDGSTLWAITRSGYCVSAMMLVADQTGRLTLEASILAGINHTFTLIGYDQLRFCRTFAASPSESELLSVLPENELVAPSIALPMYKPKYRSKAIALLQAFPQWSVFTAGGNPASPYVITGSLTAAVTLNSQCTWDALGILMCTATDAVVGDLDGTVVSGPAFRELFSRVLLTGNVRLIPPMIVAKSLERFNEVAEGIQAVLDAPFDEPM